MLAAPSRRFHTDPVLHAYAGSARRCGFDPAHVRAFFASMRRDLSQREYDDAEFDAYVYGSAEVIGLLCLSVFLTSEPVPEERREQLEDGARRLGSAFQKINFLRDYGEDREGLGRTYFPALRHRPLDDALKAELVADVRRELDAARAAIPLLPASSRFAVAAAEALYRELADAVDRTPAADLTATRISVPTGTKVLVTARAARRARKGDRSG